MNYFRSFNLDNGLIQIEDICGTKMYLVIGTESACLIDTGVGLGSIAEYVRTLTSLPLTVIVTHGHVDHAMGAGSFEDTAKVYMDPADAAVYKEHSALNMRKNYYKMTRKPAHTLGDLLENLTPVDESDWLTVRPVEDFLPLHVGDTFDVGGEVLEICPGAGHTPGCVTVLFRERRFLLLGDAINSATYLFLEHSLTCKELKHTLQELKRVTDGRYDRALTCHGRTGAGFTDAGVIDGGIYLCDAIMRGKDRHIATEASEMACFSAKRAEGGPDDIGDHSSCNILYSERTAR